MTARTHDLIQTFTDSVPVIQMSLCDRCHSDDTIHWCPDIMWHITEKCCFGTIRIFCCHISLFSHGNCLGQRFLMFFFCCDDIINQAKSHKHVLIIIKAHIFHLADMFLFIYQDLIGKTVLRLIRKHFHYTLKFCSVWDLFPLFRNCQFYDSIPAHFIIKTFLCFRYCQFFAEIFLFF